MKKAKLQIKCECNLEAKVEQEREHLYSEDEKVAMNHLANECKGIKNLKKYERSGKTIWLCSACTLFGDEELEKEIVSEDELTDMFGEGGKEEIKEYFNPHNPNL